MGASLALFTPSSQLAILQLQPASVSHAFVSEIAALPSSQSLSAVSSSVRGVPSEFSPPAAESSGGAAFVGFRWFTPLGVAVSLASSVGPSRRRRNRPGGFLRKRVRVRFFGDDDEEKELPSDEEMAKSFQKALPPEEQVRRKMVERTENTLTEADEKIAAMGIDLEAEAREQAQRLRLFPPLQDDGPLVAVCGPWPDRYAPVRTAEDGLEVVDVERSVVPVAAKEGEVDDDRGPLGQALECWLPSSSTAWFNIETLADLPPEEIEKRFKGRVSAAICPGEDLAVAARALSAILDNSPDGLIRIVLLAETGIQPAAAKVEESNDNAFEGFGNFMDKSLFGTTKKLVSKSRRLEDILTIAARERSTERLAKPPLYVTLVRATVGEVEILSQPPQVMAKLPATVGAASRGMKSMYINGFGRSAAALQDAAAASTEEAAKSTIASVHAVAAALSFSLRRGVDVREIAVLGCCLGVDDEEALWEEIMLPLVGPELWRLPVEEPRRARAWIRGWVEFNYMRGANVAGSAEMRRAGLRSPVEVREVPNGMCIKFVSGDRRPGGGFNGLDQGGLEIIVDDPLPLNGRPGRIRVRRVAYGWGVKPRESSERAILSRLRKDWELLQTFREPES